jgi:hypothetical protein
MPRRALLTAPSRGTVLKARLPATPSHSRAVISLLESICLWSGAPLRAVVDADASDVRRHPERWAMLLGDAPSVAVDVEWVGVPPVQRRDKFLGPMGEFSRARRLIRFATTGHR